MFKPLDLQNAISRSLDIQRIQQAHQSRSVTDRPDFTKEMLKNNQQINEQIQQSSSSNPENRIGEESLPKEKQRRLKPRRFPKNSDSGDAAEPENEAKQTECGQHIDIKI